MKNRGRAAVIALLLGLCLAGRSQASMIGAVPAWHDDGSIQGGVPPDNDFQAVAARLVHRTIGSAFRPAAVWDGAVSAACDDLAAAAFGRYHGLALKADGSLVVWGSGEVDEGYMLVGIQALGLAAASGDRKLVIMPEPATWSWLVKSWR